MFKFLFYAFLFYIIYRYVFGGVFGNVKVYNINNENHYHNDPEPQNEGKITINPSIQKKTKGKNDNQGEYVDYEEVK